MNHSMDRMTLSRGLRSPTNTGQQPKGFSGLVVGQCLLGFLVPYLRSFNPLSDSFSVPHQLNNGMSKNAENISVFLNKTFHMRYPHRISFSLILIHMCNDFERRILLIGHPRSPKRRECIGHADNERECDVSGLDATCDQKLFGVAVSILYLYGIIMVLKIWLFSEIAVL